MVAGEPWCEPGRHEGTRLCTDLESFDYRIGGG
jgi:hypothetical protein